MGFTLHRLGGRHLTIGTATRSRFSGFAALLLLSAVIATGCSSSGDYSVGDCLSPNVNQDGQAEKVSCDSQESFTVEELARNGGRPDCGYPNKMIHNGQIITVPIKYVADAVSATTYCGRDNYNDQSGSAFPASSGE